MRLPLRPLVLAAVLAAVPHPARGAPQEASSAPPAPATPAPATPASAVAPASATPRPTTFHTVLRDLKGKSVGKVVLLETPHGVIVRGTLRGVPRGVHALHFHETGRCQPPFKSAGGHFNPTQHAHGALDPGGLHAGDLPNLVVPRSGKLDFEILAGAVSLTGGQGMLFDADGSALVLHARADDHHTQPTGDAGDRIACAVIGR